MTIILSNSSPKIRKSGVFGPKYKDFYFFAQNLAKFEGADFKYDCFQIWFQIWFFKIAAPNIQIRHFLVPNLRILVFARNFELDKLIGVDCQYDNIPAQKPK